MIANLAGMLKLHCIFITNPPNESYIIKWTPCTMLAYMNNTKLSSQD